MVRTKRSKKRKTRSKKQKQVDYHERLLRNLFLGIIGIILLIVIIFWSFKSASEFEYKEVEFKVVKEGDLVLYQTSLPVIYKGERREFNFYLRNDPRELENVPFNGDIFFADNMVLNSIGDLNCNGDGIIAVANLVKLYEILGTKVIKDENASCDPDARYLFVQIQESDQTNIEQFDTACYNINVNECEILQSTEKFMIETFVAVHERLI